jgi:NAD(P)-dependent dehydrogenase (short-subunit alcohol dehydrogenase family)
MRSAFICSQQAVRYKMKEARRGSIVNIGSVNAYVGEPKLTAYSATKGAPMTFTKNTARYLTQYRIRVNQLNVGWTLTPNEHRVKTVERKGRAGWKRRLDETVRTAITAERHCTGRHYFASDRVNASPARCSI